MALSKPSIIVGLLTIVFFEASGVLAVDFSSTQISAGIQYEYFDIDLGVRTMCGTMFRCPNMRSIQNMGFRKRVLLSL